MKSRRTLLALWAASQLVAQAQVGVGTTTPDASAQLDVTSTALGFLPPRMTQAQREAIDTPAAGLLVYQTNGSIPGLYIHDGTAWSTFNGKVPATLTLSTSAPLTGGGALAGDLTLALPAATTAADGYLASADWTTFNAKESALTFSGPLSRSDNAISLAAASASSNGYLSSADWANFNTAYAWGDHAAAGYLTSFTETDPLFAASAAQGIAADDITAWNAKVGGSGTASYVPMFTASGTVGDSAIFSDASGKVGIGTTTPAYKLDISSASGSGRQDMFRILAGSNSIGNGATIVLGSTQTHAGYISGLQTASDTGDLTFGTNTTGDYAENMRIVGSSGNVGIGTMRRPPIFGHRIAKLSYGGWGRGRCSSAWGRSQ